MIANVAAQLQPGIEKENAFVVVCQTKLAFGSDHSRGHDAANLSFVHLEPACQLRSDCGIGHRGTFVKVPSTTDHFELPRTEVDGGKANLVGIGMGPDGRDPGHDHPVEVRLEQLIALNLVAERCQRPGQLLRIIAG